MDFKDSKKPDRLMTLEEVAEYLQLCQRSVYRMVHERKIPFFRIGRVYRFSKENLDDWLTKDASQMPEDKEKSA